MSAAVLIFEAVFVLASVTMFVLACVLIEEGKR